MYEFEKGEGKREKPPGKRSSAHAREQQRKREERAKKEKGGKDGGWERVNRSEVMTTFMAVAFPRFLLLYLSFSFREPPALRYTPTPEGTEFEGEGGKGRENSGPGTFSQSWLCVCDGKGTGPRFLCVSFDCDSLSEECGEGKKERKKIFFCRLVRDN